MPNLQGAADKSRDKI